MADEGTSSGAVRALLFLALALLAGIAALVILSQLFSQYESEISEAKQEEDKVMVIVAASDLYPGVTITEQDLYMVSIPPRFVPDQIFFRPEHVVGRIPRERILENEFIRNERLADPESGVGLNAWIPRGNRAISLPLGSGSALTGFLRPGNYVDILATVSNGRDGGGLRGMGVGGFSPSPRSRARLDERELSTETFTLLQAVFVLGVNGRMQGESWEEALQKREGGGGSVTLLVTSEQAEMLAHAMRMGTLRLTLRNDLDMNYQELAGVDVAALRRKMKQASAKKVVPTAKRRSRISPAQPKNGEVTIIRGNQRSVTTISEDGGVIRQ
jgi:pilus assembly protein CpaB